jgi:hypothetical protein
MTLCNLCSGIPFSDLPPPPSRFANWVWIDGNKETIQFWNEPGDLLGRPWHRSLGTLAELAKPECLICNIVQKAVRDWVAYYDKAEKNQRYQKALRNHDRVPYSAGLYVTGRIGGTPGFAIFSYEFKSHPMGASLLAAIGFTTGAAGLSPSIPLPALDRDSGSSRSLDLAAAWVRECVDEHPNCGGSSGTLPTRVLDAGASGDVVKLIETNASEGTYAALSYCWGNSSSNLTTTRASYKARLCGMPLSDMPKTFQDAIKFARHLQIRYIWIDSLCIIQDDPDDWSREAGRMMTVYSEAKVVIAADRSRDCHEGLFHVRNVLPSVVLELPKMGTVRAEVLYPSNELLNDDSTFGDEPLGRRAWALQERVLAKRVLHYTKKQMFFECGLGIVGETRCRRDHRFGRIDGTQPSGSDVDNALYIWRDLVHAAGKRNLSRATDKLPAMAGIAALMGPRIGGDYVAGLWSNALIDGLAWRTFATGEPTSGEYTGPSWSWAGYPGVAYSIPSKTKCVARVESWSVELKNKENPFGEVKDAWIRIHGPVTRLKPSDRYDPSDDNEMSYLEPRLCSTYSTVDEIAWFDNIEALRSGEWREWDIHLLVLKMPSDEDPTFPNSGFGLILVPTGDGRSLKMKRVGSMGDLSKLETRLWKDEACYKTLNLV